MNILEADAGRVSAIARRVAVALALREIEKENRSAGLYEAGRAALVDDLCALGRAVDLANVSDASLAVAAADPDRATSIAARTTYAARLFLRDAWVTETVGPQASPAGVDAHRYDDLQSALRALRTLGVACALAPRSLVAPLSQAVPVSLWHTALRLVAAVHAEDVESLAGVLGSQRFGLDASALFGTLRGQTGPPRGALAAAISGMVGHARERAIAALEVVDAVLESSASSHALTQSARAAYAAIAALGGDDPAQSGMIDECVSILDRVVDVAAPDMRAGARARLLLESLVCADLDGIALVPFGGALWPQARIDFEDAACPIDVERFATAIGTEAAVLRAFVEPSIRATVTLPLADALAAMALHDEPVPAARTAPGSDPKAAVVTPGMVFSASRLNSYVKCPRRFFYEYLCETLEDPGSLHATYGRVVHDALEMLHREIRMPARHEPSYILDRLLRDLDAAFGAARPDFASQLEYESSRWRARRMAEQYVRWLCAEAKRAPMEIAAVEVFERRRFGEYDFVGYIDRMDRPEGGGPATIYDYKTGRIDDDAKAYLEKVRSGEEAQLALYYAMRRAAGDAVKRIALVSIRDPRDEVWILALDVVADDEPAASVDREAGVIRAACSPEDLDASLEALLQRCDLLAKVGVARFGAGEDPPCGFCEYAKACRDRPLHGERTFAR